MSMHTISNQFFFNFDKIYFYTMHHNLDNYNVHAKFVEHNGEKCSHGITILTKLHKIIIIVLHTLWDSIIAKSLVANFVLNMLQFDNFSKITFC
jgi:hypothetical protein